MLEDDIKDVPAECNDEVTQAQWDFAQQYDSDKPSEREGEMSEDEFSRSMQQLQNQLNELKA